MSGPSAPFAVSRLRHDGAVFDLDGVITRTARLHAAAWKAMFDAFLAARGDAPFDALHDYAAWVDGRPRLEGTRSFLASRAIDLPCGAPDDAPGAATVWGLANRKNALFDELLAREGAQVAASSVALVRSLRAAGVRTAVVSASRHGAQIVAQAGLAPLFDVVLDGVDAQRRGLRGKPAPDTFLAAARALGVPPERAILFEDALAGVEAGRAAGFDLVVGVDRKGNAPMLYRHGAHVVVSDLSEIAVQAVGSGAPPSALERMHEITARAAAQRCAVFLDYDGTLTPIVQRPQDAVLDAPMRAAVQRLAARCPVAIVSGRDLADVQDRVGLPGLIYAGSHGFDISGPQGLRRALPQAAQALPVLDAAERDLRAAFGVAGAEAAGAGGDGRGIAGVIVERKRYAIAVHYRMVAARDVDAVERGVDAALRRHPGLRKRHGKKVLELQPDVDWDKGAAVSWLLDALDLAALDVLALYLGDDLTDEDAFRALAGRGIGVAVLDSARPTAAPYSLPDVGAVRAFLGALSATLEAAR